VLLALTAWAVYIGDRLLDSFAALRTGQLDPLRERHYFHYRHRRILGVMALAAACAAAWIVFRLMPVGARERNTLLAVAALAYFSGVHLQCKLPQSLLRLLTPLRSKEFFVGLLFTTGCALPAFTRAPAVPIWPLWAAAVYFAAMAWLNCHAIERWELAGQLRFGTTIYRPATLLGLAGLFTGAALCAVEPRAAALLLAGAASALLLALLDRYLGQLTPLGLRVAADLVLLSPLLIAPFALAAR
jgi:hypothetical protein